MTCEGRDPDGVLTGNDLPPVEVINPAGPSSFLLLGDHAGNAVPNRLDQLRLGQDDLARHIGWDIGVARLGASLARTLDAVFIRQTYSRLVIDCNRDPDAADAIPEESDGTVVPGNRALSHRDRAARIAGIHAPYHAAIADMLARRDAASRQTVIVALHSFTPTMGGSSRPWHAGVLHDGGNPGFALTLLAALRAEPDLIIGDNAPYRMDATDHTVPRHAYAQLRPYAELEIRQDLLGTPDGCERWSQRLARLLVRSLPIPARTPI